MPTVCWVPDCTTGYRTNLDTSRHLFRAPTDQERLKQWENSIPRVGIRILASRHHICDLHFEDRFLLKSFQGTVNGEKWSLLRDRWNLTSDAIPTLFSNRSQSSKVLRKKFAKTKKSTKSKPAVVLSENSMAASDASAVVESQVDRDTMSLEAAHNFQLLQSLSSFQRQGLFCDTIIQTKECAISAHSVILSSFSPLLASLLNQQPMNDNNSNVIDLSVYDTELIQELVNFFYTGKIQLLRLGELEELCKVLDVRLVLESIFSPGKDGIKSESNEKEESSAVEDASNVTVSQSVQRSKSVMKTMHRGNIVDNERNARQTSEEHLESHSSALNGASSRDEDVHLEVDSGTFPELLYPQGNETFSNLSVELDFLSDYMDCKTEMLSETEEINPYESDANEQNSAGNVDECKTRCYCCSVCGDTFSSKTKRSVHWFNHFLTENRQEYICDKCPKVIALTNKKGLRDHLKRHDVSNLKKDHVCSWCGLKFRAPTLLKDHVNLHTGLKPHACQLCGKSFASSQSLHLHARYHTKEKRYLCTFCGKDFYRHNNYSTHMSTHTGVKPYECKVCKYRCSQSGTLKVHMRMHTSEKPYQCTLCPESFVSNSQLKLHMGRTHTSNEERPFKCTSCGKGFAFNYILRAHAKVHSKPHCCMACGRKFAMQCKLKLHLKTCKGPKKKKFFPDNDEFKILC